jgi:antitoxin HicB
VSVMRYRIELHPAPPEEGGYTVTVPSLPGVVTEGDTLEEAIAMAKDAIEGYIADLEAHGEPVPESDEMPEVIVAVVDVAA